MNRAELIAWAAFMVYLVAFPLAIFMLGTAPR